eukprot:352564-Chlamydomonas_euryale.AAC.3
MHPPTPQSPHAMRPLTPQQRNGQQFGEAVPLRPRASWRRLLVRPQPFCSASFSALRLAARRPQWPLLLLAAGSWRRHDHVAQLGADRAAAQ